LSTEEGIVRASANSTTGNILVLFHPKYSPQAIASRLARFVSDYRKENNGTGETVSSYQLPVISYQLPVTNPKSKIQNPKSLAPPWHLKEAGEILTELETSQESGLSYPAAQEKLQRYGLNALPEASPRSGLSIFIDYFKSVPVALLSAAAGLSLVTGGLADALVIMGVVVINAALGYATESQSERIVRVPEGLPTVATTTLALGIWEMRKRNVLIRRLDAVEALGSVQTICLDKTGTLTANQMSVVEICADNCCIQVSEGKLMAGEAAIAADESEPLLKLIEISVLCNGSEVSRGQDGQYIVSGSATEKALIYLALVAEVDVLEVREQHPLVETNHRSETQNFMRTRHVSPGGQQLVAIKGNPTEVLELCDWQLKEGEVVPLTEAERLAIEIENERMASKALRVLGAAYTQGNGSFSPASHQENPIWLGLIGMADPIRNGVRALMGNFHQAGIETVMITGDQSPTAYAVGKELNLSHDEPLEILDSTHLADIDPEVMKGLCQRVHVFARISPAHKLQIVQSLQRAGRVVAMTGDGINDAPALKAAEVGIAMGHTGTDVAREVADVVLEDDNLATTIVAVSQGRTIYSNIRKSVHFLLSTNLSEIGVMLISTTAGMGQPLNAMQLLWLNLVTDIFPGLALALEPPEPDVLRQPPRPPNEPILKPSDFRQITLESTTLSISTLGAYGYGIGRYGISPRSSTIAFMSLVMGQLFHAISCRSEKQGIFSEEKLPPNRYLAIALGGSFALQLMSIAIPWLRSLLNLTAIDFLDSAVIGSSALLPLIVHETAKEVNSKKEIAQV
jgi:Ca2+-transporting ATPase